MSDLTITWSAYDLATPTMGSFTIEGEGGTRRLVPQEEWTEEMRDFYRQLEALPSAHRG